MDLRKLAVFAAEAGLAIGLVGAGVGATFTSANSANENISVGNMSIQVVLKGPGSHQQPPADCTVHVVTASGTYTCDLKVTRSGDIIPNDLKVAVTVGSGQLKEPSKWAISDDGHTGQPLSGAVSFDYPSPYPSPTCPSTFEKFFTVTWSYLGNDSEKNVVTLLYTVTAYQS